MTLVTPDEMALIATELEMSMAAIEVRPRGWYSEHYQDWRRHYYVHPDLFMLECVDWHEWEEGPSFYQMEVAVDALLYGRESVRGPHGLGKTALASLLITWFALTRDGEDWKVPTTASSYTQLVRYLWPEVRKWTYRLKWDLIGRPAWHEGTELLKQAINGQTGQSFAIASETPERIEGAHARKMLYVFDESKAIQDATFDAVEGAFSNFRPPDPAKVRAARHGDQQALDALIQGQEVYALAISTPGAPIGRFWEIQTKKPGTDDWHVRHVTWKEANQAGQITTEWTEARRRQWGNDSSVFQNRVLGEFAAEEEDGVIPSRWVELAFERWWDWVESLLHVEIDAMGRKDWKPWATRAYLALSFLDTLGVDVARTGIDNTVMAPAIRDIVVDLRLTSHEDTMMTANRAAAILARWERQVNDGHARPIAIVDVIGLGAGVVDRLREKGYEVAAYGAGGRSTMRDRSGELSFAGLRSQNWWLTRERLDPTFGATVCLPPSDRLLGDLTAPKYDVRSNVIYVEQKESFKKRLGRSPDEGDAVVQALSDPTVSRIERVSRSVAAVLAGDDL